jgi:hypothetical protein
MACFGLTHFVLFFIFVHPLATRRGLGQAGAVAGLGSIWKRQQRKREILLFKFLFFLVFFISFFFPDRDHLLPFCPKGKEEELSN